MAITEQHGMNIPGISCVLSVEENALAHLLGFSENPAHTRWQLRSRGGLTRKYPNGPKIVKFVTAASQQIVSLLMSRGEELDLALLEHLFYIPEPDDGKRPKSKKKRGKKKVTPDPPPPITPNYYLECTRVEGGFKIKRHEKAERTPQGVRIKAAYEVATGNAFKSHHPADFNLLEPKRPLKIVAQGVEPTGSGNAHTIELTITDAEFSYSITGFDPNRDLFLEIRPLHELGSTSD